MTDGNPIGLEERKNELFATITLLAGVKRDLVGARGARRFALIERQAQLEADKERLSHEINSEYMYRNLQAFMNRVDDAEKRLSSELGGLRTGQTDLQAEFRQKMQGVQDTVSTLAETVDDLQTGLRESQDDRKAIHAELVAAQEDRQAIHSEIAEVKDKLIVYMAGSKRGEVAVLQEQVGDLLAERKKYTPEELALYTAILPKMIVEWIRTHPDDV